MSDHYCCKRCGLRYDDCFCPTASPEPELSKELRAAAQEYLDAYAEAVEIGCSHIWLGLKNYGNPDMIFVTINHLKENPQ